MYSRVSSSKRSPAARARSFWAAMAASKHLGASTGAVVSYANSGDALVGDRDRVVGYGAVVFHGGEPRSGDQSFPRMFSNIEPAPLSSHQQLNLLNFARKSLSQFIETETLPLPRPVVVPGIPGCVGCSAEMLALGRRVEAGEDEGGDGVAERTVHLTSPSSLPSSFAPPFSKGGIQGGFLGTEN